VLNYFDDEKECITISDEIDYESFLIFCAEEGIKIPKLLITAEGEAAMSYEQSVSELNWTMCVSYIGDSEIGEESRPVEIPNVDEVIKLRNKIQEMEKEIYNMTSKQIE